MSFADTISMPAAFLAGMLSFLSPCVLPLVPAYLSYMSGTSFEDMTVAKNSDALKHTGLKSIFFVLGFSMVFVLLGATATSLGQLLVTKLGMLTRIGGAIVIVFGLHMTGLFRVRALYSEKRLHTRLRKVGFFGAFIIGVTFAFGWTPCIGPVLAAILALAANSDTLSRGIGLLSAYSLGLGIPFILAGFATGTVLKALTHFKKHFRKVEIASGLLIMAVGILLFTGRLQMLTFGLGQ